MGSQNSSRNSLKSCGEWAVWPSSSIPQFLMRVNLWQDLVDWPCWVIIVDYFLNECPLSHHKVCLTNRILVVNGFFSFWSLANAQAQVKNNSRADDSSQNYIFSLGFWRAAGMDWVVEEMVNYEVSFLLYFTHVIWFSCFVWKFHEMEEKIRRDGCMWGLDVHVIYLAE